MVFVSHFELTVSAREIAADDDEVAASNDADGVAFWLEALLTA
jgi:hypothetical protein